MNPWEKYQQPDAGNGPWAKYQAAAPEQPNDGDLSVINRLQRQLGLTGRYVLEGLGGVGQIFSEPLRQGLNLIPGVDIDYASASALPKKLGMPQPQGSIENVVGDASRMLVSASPFLKGAQIATKAANPMMSAASKVMAENPLGQALAASSGGASSGVTREMGGGQNAQLIASLLGSMSPAIAGNAIGKATGGFKDFLVSPEQRKNVMLLQREGVKPTIGQTIGGRTGALEEKLQSVPVLGDSITATKGRGLEQFNSAAINRAVSPIGKKVTKIGHEGIKEAGDLLSTAYDKALSKIKYVNIDDNFNAALSEVEQQSAGLEKTFADKFTKLLETKVLSNAAGGNLKGDKFKSIVSDLGKEAARFSGFENSAARDYGNAVNGLKGVLMRQAARSANPKAMNALKAADKGYANLVRIEQAAKSAKNNNGVFTPGQLNSAAQITDKSVRRRAVSRGTALMQDLSTAGQNVLGNKVPNSGTAERLFYGAGTLGASLANPMVIPGLLTGAAGYTGPAQNALVKALLSRPEYGAKLQNTLLRASPYLAAQPNVVQ